jgi:hypothetical protein
MTTSDEVAASHPAVSSGGGKDVSLYQDDSPRATLDRLAAGLTNRYLASGEDSGDEYRSGH